MALRAFGPARTRLAPADDGLKLVMRARIAAVGRGSRLHSAMIWAPSTPGDRRGPLDADSAWTGATAGNLREPDLAHGRAPAEAMQATRSAPDDRALAQLHRIARFAARAPSATAASPIELCRMQGAAPAIRSVPAGDHERVRDRRAGTGTVAAIDRVVLDADDRQRRRIVLTGEQRHAVPARSAAGR